MAQTQQRIYTDANDGIDDDDDDNDEHNKKKRNKARCIDVVVIASSYDTVRFGQWIPLIIFRRESWTNRRY